VLNLKAMLGKVTLMGKISGIFFILNLKKIVHFECVVAYKPRVQDRYIF
jgi:hypothetical protein